MYIIPSLSPSVYTLLVNDEILHVKHCKDVLPALYKTLLVNISQLSMFIQWIINTQLNMSKVAARLAGKIS